MNEYVMRKLRTRLERAIDPHVIGLNVNFYGAGEPHSWICLDFSIGRKGYVHLHYNFYEPAELKERGWTLDGVEGWGDLPKDLIDLLESIPETFLVVNALEGV